MNNKQLICERCGLKTATYMLLLCSTRVCDGCSYDLITNHRREGN